MNHGYSGRQFQSQIEKNLPTAQSDHRWSSLLFISEVETHLLSPLTLRPSDESKMCTAKQVSQEFPRSPVVQTPNFDCQGPGSVPSWGTKIPQAIRCGQNWCIMSYHQAQCPSFSLRLRLLDSIARGRIQRWFTDFFFIHLLNTFNSHPVSQAVE